MNAAWDVGREGGLMRKKGERGAWGAVLAMAGLLCAMLAAALNAAGLP